MLKDELAYSKLVQIIKDHFDNHYVTYNSIHWIGEGNYISADKQFELLNFSCMNDGIFMNIGSYYAELCHDVINIIIPPQNVEEI